MLQGIGHRNVEKFYERIADYNLMLKYSFMRYIAQE